jgi:hypothetical protein
MMEGAASGLRDLVIGALPDEARAFKVGLSDWGSHVFVDVKSLSDAWELLLVFRADVGAVEVRERVTSALAMMGPRRTAR